MTDFETFWRWYLSMHRRPSTQRLHALATLSAAALLATGLWRRSPLLLLLAPLVDHAIAQLAHRGFEHNITHPWKHPLWHLRAELRLARQVLAGRTPS